MMRCEPRHETWRQALHSRTTGPPNPIHIRTRNSIDVRRRNPIRPTATLHIKIPQYLKTLRLDRIGSIEATFGGATATPLLKFLVIPIRFPITDKSVDRDSDAPRKEEI